MCEETPPQSQDGSAPGNVEYGQQLREAGLAAHRAGLSPIPISAHGSKMPATRTHETCGYPKCSAARKRGTKKSWAHYQHDRATTDEIRRWFPNGISGGLGVVTGYVSGNLEMLELEGRAVDEGVWAAYQQLAKEAGLGELLDRVVNGYCSQTPSGGIHLLYFLPEAPEGNTKLANRPATDDELAKKPKEKTKGLIETRGEGGFTAEPPSNGRCHTTGLP